MAKPKFTLVANPTFPAAVAIPVPGGKPVEVVFTFKHRTKDEFKKFSETSAGREDVEVLLAIASGWDLDEPFDADHLETLIQNYLGSAQAVVETYVSELTSARSKN